MTTPARKKAGKAAAAETSAAAQPHTVQWRGIEFTTPAVLPAELAWALADVESSSNQVGPMLALIRSLIGDEQEQVLRNRLTELEVGFPDVPEALTELLTAIFAEYGMAEGDSPASAAS